MAQDSPGRIEVGANLTAIRNPPLGATGNLGPGVQADLNFGRYFALDGRFDVLPSTSFNGQTLIGLFGVKAGKRTKRLGFFGTARPGFISIGNTLLASTITVGSPPVAVFGRFTQRALNLGGVMEYYPASHWALRWDAGDTLVFDERFPVFTAIIPGTGTLVSATPSHVSNHLLFSAGMLYRFGKK